MLIQRALTKKLLLQCLAQIELFFHSLNTRDAANNYIPDPFFFLKVVFTTRLIFTNMYLSTLYKQDYDSFFFAFSGCFFVVLTNSLFTSLNNCRLDELI